MTYILNTLPSDESQVPQSEPLPGMVRNAAGGYAYALPDLATLNRFLIIGSESGTYYQNSTDLTTANVACLMRLLDAGNLDAVRLIGSVSQRGLAPKNDHAIVALAFALGHSNNDVFWTAAQEISNVIRTGTHLYLLMESLKRTGGLRRRRVRTQIGHFLAAQSARSFEMNTVKYGARHNWSMAQVLDVVRPRSSSPAWNAVAWWANYRSKGWSDSDGNPRYLPRDVTLNIGSKRAGYESFEMDMLADTPLIAAYEAAHWAESEQQIVRLIVDSHLPWEAIPTQWLGSAAVWDALLWNMKPEAMLRNLARMTANGLLTAGSAEHIAHIERTLTNHEILSRARLHPMKFLVALRTYMSGQSARGSSSWRPVPAIGEIIEQGFYNAFEFVAPTGKRRLFAVDVSHSMTQGVADFPGLSARDVAACLMMVLKRTEPGSEMVAFSDGQRQGKFLSRYGTTDNMVTPIEVESNATLAEVSKLMADLNFGGTDCALPVLWASEAGKVFDSVEIITDNETYFGGVHPSAALRAYRQKIDRPTRMVSIGVTATNYTIADPNDPLMFDIAGFSADMPQVLSAFVKGQM